MRGLPGEDKTVNNMTESKLRQLFDTGHGKAGGEKKSATETVEEEEEDGQDDDQEEEATGKQGGKAVLLEDKMLVQAKALKNKG